MHGKVMQQLLVLSAALGAPPGTLSRGIAPRKLAAVSLLVTPSDSLRIRLGTPSKHPASPLLVQDRPWEAPPSRIDNGYPNVIPPQEQDGDIFQLWYGSKAWDGTRHRSVLLYANSTDGLHWDKPDLGLFNFETAGFSNVNGSGTKNNVIVEGDGIGVYYDPHDPDASRRYKAVGDACWLSPTLAYQKGLSTCENLYTANPAPPGQRPRFHGVIASSADGLTWPRETHVVNTSWPPPHKWDTHSNVFFDPRSQAYVLTTRAVPIEADGLERETSLTRSLGAHFRFNTSQTPPVIVRGNVDYQPYAQVTFPWLNVYLGLNMLYDQGDPDGKVHCRLTMSMSPEGPWRVVEGHNITEATDFVPLGAPGSFDSHIIFAAARPFRQGAGADSREWMYYMGGNGPHSGERNSSLGLATLRPDGFASVRGRGTFITPSIMVTDAVLMATVDFAGGATSSSLQIGVIPDNADEPPAALSLRNSVPLRTNATDTVMHWRSGHTLSSFVGQTVKLEVSLVGDAMLYTIGFAPQSAAL